MPRLVSAATNEAVAAAAGTAAAAAAAAAAAGTAAGCDWHCQLQTTEGSCSEQCLP